MKIHQIAVSALLLSVAGAWSQDPLVGKWVGSSEDEDGTFTSELIMRADSSATISFRGDFGTEAFEDEDIPQEVFPEEFVVGFEGAGTWRTEGNLLFLQLQERALLINDEPYEDVIADIGQALALSLVEELEIAEEDVPAFIELIQQGLSEDLNEEALLSEFLALLDSGVEYTVVGDLMTTVDTETGELDLWTRVEATAVVGASWAAVKRGAPWTK